VVGDEADYRKESVRRAMKGQKKSQAGQIPALPLNKQIGESHLLHSNHETSKRESLID